MRSFRPVQQEVALTAIMASWRGLTAGFIWFNSIGVSTTLAFGLTLFQITLVVIHGLWQRWFDHFFAMSFSDPNQATSQIIQYFRRQGYSLFLTEVLRFLSGPANGAEPLLSLRGQLQIVLFLATVGTGDALLSSARARAFGGDAVLNSRLSFLSFMVLAPLTLADFSGVGRHFCDIGCYPIRDTTLAILVFYCTSAGLVTYRPEWVERVLRSVEPRALALR